MPASRSHSPGLALLAAAVLTIAPVADSSAAKYTTLYSFTGIGQGSGPGGKPLLDAKGDIFGTTQYAGGGYPGTIYSFSASSVFTVLHTFQAAPDGAEPIAGVVANSAGDLYGTTTGGGSANVGSVFRIGALGANYRLDSFHFLSGANLTSGLVLDAAGNLYGMATQGGANKLGTVYKVQPDGEISVLHSFTGGADGQNPLGGSLAQDSAGNLYGTTSNGGANGYGVIFKVTPAGEETVIYTFNSKNNGCFEPNNSLAIDTAGNLYGSTSHGGGEFGQGCVYRFSPDAALTVLHVFGANNSGTAGGAYPLAGVTLDAQGNIYGVTTLGGYDNAGTIYRITPTGQYTVLYSFTNGSDGAGNFASELAITPTGALLGVDGVGGTYGYGNLFTITP
jgi:uncharacterized repeat protein (TIGR03803 family)